jgi:hypothetical protein
MKRDVAIASGVSMFEKSLRDPAEYKHNVIKRSNNGKLGKAARVTGGPFKNYTIHTLTLEERATCPASCFHYKTCFGNNMPFAHRIIHGPELEKRIASEIEELCGTYAGVMVRLHVLGDFYSPEYVKLWHGLLSRYDNLAAWGYTHRRPWSAIGKEIQAARNAFGMRWSIRWSDAPNMKSQFTANSERLDSPEPGQSLVCPEQTGASPSCADCMLCWMQPERRIVFLDH